MKNNISFIIVVALSCNLWSPLAAIPAQITTARQNSSLYKRIKARLGQYATNMSPKNIRFLARYLAKKAQGKPTTTAEDTLAARIKKDLKLTAGVTLATIVLLALGGGFAFYGYKKRQKKKETNTPPDQDSTAGKEKKNPENPSNTSQNEQKEQPTPGKRTNKKDISKEQQKELNKKLLDMHQWLLDDNVDSVKKLLDQGANPNVKSDLYGESRTALMQAAFTGQKELVKLLLSFGAKTNGALDLAQATGKVEIVKLLLDAGANPNELNQNGKTPLSEAISYDYNDNNRQITQLLLNAKGIDINATGRDGNSALRKAVTTNNYEVAKQLIDRKANVNDILNNESLLEIAINDKRNPAMAKLLLVHGADPNRLNEYGKTLLSQLATEPLDEQRREIIAILLSDKKTNVNQQNNDGTTPLEAAMLFERFETIERLIASGADPNQSLSKFAAYTTWDNNALKAVQALLKSKNLIINAKDNNGHTPLQKAVRAKNTAAVQLFLDHGATITDPSLMEAAVANNDPAMIDLLSKKNAPRASSNTQAQEMLSKIAGKRFASDNELKSAANILNNTNIDINAPGSNGKTPLQEAVTANNTKVVALLLDHKATIDDPSLLETAVSNKEPAILKLLLDKGANPNRHNAAGKTLLSKLINNQKFFGQELELVKLLLSSASIDTNAADKDGQTPLTRAIENDNLEAIEQLLSHGATMSESLLTDVIANKKDILAGWSADTNESSQIAEILLKHGANSDSGPKDKIPLHEAISHANPPVLKLLMMHGADPNKLDQKRNTPLMNIIKQSYNYPLTKKLIDILFSYKADVNIPDINGQSPIGEIFSRFSITNDAIAIAKVLYNYGARLNSTDVALLGGYYNQRYQFAAGLLKQWHDERTKGDG